MTKKHTKTATPSSGLAKKSNVQSTVRPKSEKVQLIEHRRACNCEIMLSKVKVPLQDLMSSVLALEESLDVDQFENLIKCCPAKEETQTINKGLEKIVQELSTSENDGPISEKFCKKLKDFLCSAEAEVRSLASLYSWVGRNVDALILYFGEDPSRCLFE